MGDQPQRGALENLIAEVGRGEAMVTADVARSTQMRAADLRVFEFMRKPVQPQELIDTVGRALAFTDRAAA